MTKLERLTDHVYLFDQQTPGMRVRGAVVLGTDKAVVFDTLVLAEELSEVRELCVGKEIIVVYSHADWDHVWGTPAFDFAEVIGHKRCLERFEDPNDVIKSLKEHQKQKPELYKNVKLIAPTKTFNDRLSLELGGVNVELSHLPGHSLDGIMAFVPEDGVLLAGDAVETALPVINEDSPLSAWISLLKNWSTNQKVKTVVPSHGEIQGKELLNYNIAYLKAMQNNEPFEIPYEMDEFYTTVHAENQKIAPNLS